MSRLFRGRELGEGGGLLTAWLAIGILAVLNPVLPEEAFTQDLPRVLALYGAADHLWTRTERTLARRSARPLSVAVPVATISLLLSHRFVAPFDPGLFAAVAAVAGILNLAGLGVRRIRSLREARTARG